MIVANCLDRAVHPNALGDLHDPLDRVLVPNVDSIGAPQPARDPEAEGLEVGDDAQCRICAMAEHIKHRQAQLTCSQDSDALPRLHPAALQDMVSQAIHLDHRCMLYGDALGQRVYMAGRRRHVLPKAAVQVDTQ